MRTSTLISGAMSCLLASGLSAQVTEGPRGPIEFIGLERWTPRQVLDTLAVLAPGKPLHACAVVLKDQLQFADAAVNIYLDAGGRMYTVVSVVEPEHRGRVRYRAAPREHLAAEPLWDSLAAVLHNPRMAQAVALTYPLWQAGLRDSAFAFGRMIGGDSADLVFDFALLSRVARSSDAELAERLLTSDSSADRRKAAVLVLTQSPQRDGSWWALVGAQLDSNQQIGALASQLLGSLVKQHSRVVDWSPIAPTIRDILGGSNLFALVPTMRVLAATRVSPRLAPALLGGAGSTVLAFAGAVHDEEHRASRELLAALSGRSADTPLDDWRSWVASLSAH